MITHLIFLIIHWFFIGFEVAELAFNRGTKWFVIVCLILNVVCAVLHFAIIENELRKK